MNVRRRVNAARNALAGKRLDAMIVSTPVNVRYLSGFTGSNGLCVVTKRSAFFITDPRYTIQSSAEVRGFRRIVGAKGLFQAAADGKVLSRIRRAGFEEEHLTVAGLRTLRRLFPAVTFVPLSGVVESIEAVKDEGELALMRKAAKISDTAFARLMRWIEPGMRETDIATELSRLHRQLGAEGDAFESIVASGERGALPHARPTSRRIRRGEFVTLDFGCRVGGYNSDITRTIAVGRPPDRLLRAYDVVLEAQTKAIAAVADGVTAKDVDAVAREHIHLKGFGRYFVHGLGHGLGLSVHEPLRLSALSKDTLCEGNVTTIEPGVYIPNLGGVRIEDDVVVRRDGCTMLTHSPRELITV